MSGSTSKNAPMISKIEASFKNDVMKEALKSQFSNSKTKMNDDAVELMSELAKTIAVESAVRVAKQASLRNQQKIKIDHFESVLPQLMLDFP